MLNKLFFLIFVGLLFSFFSCSPLLGPSGISGEEKKETTTVTNGPNIFVSQGPNTILSGTAGYPIGSVNIGNSVDIVFKIENRGNASLVITGSPFVKINGNSFSLVSDIGNSTILPNSSETFTIKFSPTQVMSYSAIITIFSNDPNKPVYSFSISGNGVDLFTVTTPYFSHTAGSYTSLFSLSITNNTPGSSIYYTLDGSSVVLPSVCGTPGTGSTLLYTASIPLTTSVVVKAKACKTGMNPSLENMISYTFIPVIAVKQGSLDITSNSSFNFGFQQVGTNSSDKIYTIVNNGASILTISLSLSDNTNFTLNTMGMLTSIPVGGSTNFSIRFNPTSTGVKNAILQISSNDPFQNIFVINFSGTGGVPQLKVYDPNNNFLPSGSGSYDCGVIVVNNNYSFNIFLKNNGTQVLNVNSIVSSKPSIFVISSNITSIDPGDQLPLEIYFRNSVIGYEDATITVNTNDPITPIYTFTVKGRTVARLDSSPSETGKWLSLKAQSGVLYLSYYDETWGDLKFSKSLDGGNTWTTQTLDSSGVVGEYTSLAVAGNYVYVSYYDASDMLPYLKKSTDNGNTWSSPILLGSTVGAGKFTSIATDSTGQYVLVAYIDEVNKKIMLARSPDFGVNWMNIPLFPASLMVGQVVLTSTGSGLSSKFYTAFVAEDKLYHRYSTDSGITWSTAIPLLSGITNDQKISIATNGTGNVYLHTWRDSDNQTYLYYSLDNGVTYNSYFPFSSASQYAAITVDSMGRLHYLFSANANNDIMVGRKNDPTTPGLLDKTFLLLPYLSPVERKHLDIAVDGNTIYAAVYNSTIKKIFVFKSTDGGTTW